MVRSTTQLLTQVTAVFAIAVPNMRLDSQPAKYASGGLTVVARIGIQLLRMRARTSWLATDERIIYHDR